ncbi:hypothetical protein Tco_0727599 [Tanacetum coccineum]|uniref:Uncharacterized protein n=1 Tax=Tanacetum coccineum TaxID=301880 RepID=A0ABQ4YLT7_9ASTR
MRRRRLLTCTTWLWGNWAAGPPASLYNHHHPTPSKLRPLHHHLAAAATLFAVAAPPSSSPHLHHTETITSTIVECFHSKTKHIAIRHHFIRDAYEKKLIQVLKIHTDDNVADLLTKAFDVSRESLGRALDGTEALLLPKLFILWLAKVSTDSAKLIPLGKDSTAIETLKKIPPRV